MTGRYVMRLQPLHKRLATRVKLELLESVSAQGGNDG